MLPIRRLALLLTLLSLVACEQSPNPSEKPKAETAKVQPAQDSADSKVGKAEPALIANKPAQPRANDPKTATSAQAKPKPAAVARTPEPTKPKAPLDLSLHPNVFDPLQSLEPLNDLPATLLPPLFGEKVAPESPFQLNGKLITNEHGDDYWQSVEGAQLQFEFRQ